MEQLFKSITKNVIINDNQGYAFYYKQDEIEIKKVNGLLHSQKEDKINFESMFRLASVTKQFIGLGIILLVKENKLSFDTSVLDIYKDLPSYFKDIKIINLLNHSSGIYDYEDMEHTECQIHDEDILTFLKTTTKTYFEVGSKYQYSNTAYILLGLIIEIVSNEKISDYLDRKIFKKVGMDNTLVNYEGITKITNRALGHIIEDNKLIMKDQYWCSATIGDGGLYSNVDDLNKWVSYLLMHIDEYSNDLLSESILTNVSDTYYGMGIRTVKVNDKKIYYHSGSTIGTNTLVLFSKDFNLRCIFLTNVNGIDTTIIKNNILELINS